MQLAPGIWSWAHGLRHLFQTVACFSRFLIQHDPLVNPTKYICVWMPVGLNNPTSHHASLAGVPPDEHGPPV